MVILLLSLYSIALLFAISSTFNTIVDISKYMVKYIKGEPLAINWFKPSVLWMIVFIISKILERI